MAPLRGLRRRLGLRSEAPCADGDGALVRDELRLTGAVRELISVPRGSTFDLVVSLDGNMTSLVWWGRQGIPGLVVGRTVTAWGRPGLYRNQPALLNPTYELGVTHE